MQSQLVASFPPNACAIGDRGGPSRGAVAATLAPLACHDVTAFTALLSTPLVSGDRAPSPS